MCNLTVPMKGQQRHGSEYTTWSVDAPGWEYVTNGAMVRSRSDEEIEEAIRRWEHLQRKADAYRAEERAKMEPRKLHACPECVAALRQAQVVAFDQCLQVREGLNRARYTHVEMKNGPHMPEAVRRFRERFMGEIEKNTREQDAAWIAAEAAASYATFKKAARKARREELMRMHPPGWWRGHLTEPGPTFVR